MMTDFRQPRDRKTAILPTLALLLAGGLALAGCNKEKAPEGQPAAGVELLPRSVNDDMPGYDTVRSQAPYEDPEAAEALQRRSAANAPVAPAAPETPEGGEDDEAGTPAPSPSAGPSASPAPSTPVSPGPQPQ